MAIDTKIELATGPDNELVNHLTEKLDGYRIKYRLLGGIVASNKQMKHYITRKSGKVTKILTTSRKIARLGIRTVFLYFLIISILSLFSLLEKYFWIILILTGILFEIFIRPIRKK